MNRSGNTILITGGSSGIGYEMAKQFIALDNQVIITGRNLEKLEKAKSELGAVNIIQSDVSSPNSIKQLYNQVLEVYPSVNVLINSAGVMSEANLQQHDMSPLELANEIDINFKGTIWMNDAFIPLIKKRKAGAIVNVSSALAYMPLPICAVYSATKAAVHSYTLSLRAQLSNTDVRVFELAPPATDTKLLSFFHEGDLKGSIRMKVDKLVEVFMKGFAKNKYEIRPGQSKQLWFMSRFFPTLMLKLLSRSVKRMEAA